MKYFALLLFSLPLCLSADKVVIPRIHPEVPNPWLTGPLLAPSSVVVPLGHVNYEPYVYVTAITGSYDKDWKAQSLPETFWANSLEPVIQVGLLSWMNIQVTPALFYNYHDHAARWDFGDFPVEFDIQLYQPERADGPYPFVKLSFVETFPTGKYKKFDPSKKGVQATGAGSYQTSVGLVIGKLVHFGGVHFMTARLFLQYTLPAATRLKGLNIYGGAEDTNARLFPGQNFVADLGLELTLAQRWALACDLYAIWSKKSHFSGNPGTLSDGSPAPLGTLPAAQYSLAPAIEYNWSENLGVIAGSWFTFAGRNTGRFWSAVIAVNYYQ